MFWGNCQLWLKGKTPFLKMADKIYTFFLGGDTSRADVSIFFKRRKRENSTQTLK